MLLGFEDHALLTRRHPIEELLEADYVILLQVSLCEGLQSSLFVICAVCVNDGSHEEIHRQKPDTSSPLANHL